MEGHELYCAGHLIEAAVAHYQATGKVKLLNIACRFADLIDSIFGTDKRRGYPGHPEIELALIRLYEVTREERYLSLAGYFINERGSGMKIFLMKNAKRRTFLYFPRDGTFQGRLFPIAPARSVSRSVSQVMRCGQCIFTAVWQIWPA